MSKRLLVYVVLALVAIGVFFFFDPLKYSFFPKCPFKVITGYNCPGCGFQRAIHALLHGNIIQAIRYNIFMVIAMPYILAVIAGNYLFTGEKKAKILSVVEGKTLALTYVVLFFVWLFVRNYFNI